MKWVYEPIGRRGGPHPVTPMDKPGCILGARSAERVWVARVLRLPVAGSGTGEEVPPNRPPNWSCQNRLLVLGLAGRARAAWASRRRSADGVRMQALPSGKVCFCKAGT